MWNQIKTPFEGIRTYCLVLDTRHHLDLFQALYVPSISHNLIFLSKLVSIEFFFTFEIDVSFCLNTIILLVM